jgi:hypothetical protein
VRRLVAPIHQFLGEFAVDALPEGFCATTGSIRPFEETEVCRHLSASAKSISSDDPWLELYAEGERFWLVDERWGICEMNLLRQHWRSWILPQPQADSIRTIEGAVLWPLAQLLRARGQYLIPAASVTRGGRGMLLIGAVEPELTRLVRAGYRLIGQKWTLLREEDGRIDMLRVGGVVERQGSRSRQARLFNAAQWVDLEGEYLGSAQNHAFCDDVILIEGRRSQHWEWSHLTSQKAAAALRCSWPIVDLRPTRRSSLFASRLAERCRCVRAHLSRNPTDFLDLLADLHRDRQDVSMLAS